MLEYKIESQQQNHVVKAINRCKRMNNNIRVMNCQARNYQQLPCYRVFYIAIKDYENQIMVEYM